MRFRTRVLAACMTVAIVPLVGLAVGVRREVNGRLSAQYHARAVALGAATRDELNRESTEIGERLAALRDALADDNRFRSAAVQHDPRDREYLLDDASQVMRASGLAMLQIQGEDGRILSSGHFRNEFDRLEPDLPRLLATAAGGAALVDARTPDGPLRVIARVDSVRLAGHRYTMIGGVAVNASFLRRLAPDTEFSVALVGPDPIPPGAPPAEAAPLRPPMTRDPDAGDVSTLPFPIVAPDPRTGQRSLQLARFTITHSGAELASLERGVDAWVIAAVSVSILAALLAAIWLAEQVSGPLRDLAAETARIDLDRLDTAFSNGRADEVGDLARLLDAMTRRLRSSTIRWRDAERRATIGDLARQVTHDVKNGLVPLRHVLRHLADVERDHPDRLGPIFAERRPTLDASVEYLDALARSYARLSRPLERHPCDLNALARQVAAAASTEHPSVRLALDPSAPVVLADPLVLRRILDNLVANAVDAVAPSGGRVTLSTSVVPSGRACIAVADDGPGMTDAERAQAFDDFYTTKATGTGLGLSIVRRLATDLGATLQVTTAPGAGTTVTVTL